MAFRLFAQRQPRRAEWVDHSVLLAPQVRYSQLTRDQRRTIDRLMASDIVRARRPRIHHPD